MSIATMISQARARARVSPEALSYWGDWLGAFDSVPPSVEQFEEWVLRMDRATESRVSDEIPVAWQEGGAA